jgi:hypothetical protein
LFLPRRWRIVTWVPKQKPTAECQRWVFKSFVSSLVLEPPIARRVSHRNTIIAQCANQRGGTHVRKHIFVTGNVHFIELRRLKRLAMISSTLEARSLSMS